MKNFILERQHREPIDIILLITIVLLTGIGLAMLFSASYINGIAQDGNPAHFLKTQIVTAVVGIIGGLILSALGLEFLAEKKIIPLVTLVCVIVCFITALIGQEINGARRWLLIGGISFQPSELMKICLIFYMAFDFVKQNDRKNSGNYSHSIVMMILCCLSVIAEKDLSGTIFIGALGMAMLWVSPLKKGWLILLAIAAVALLGLMIILEPYRMKRMFAFLNPDWDPQGNGFQIRMGLATLASGGFWGKGIGCSTFKMGDLPEAMSDYIFAIVGEELGFVGVFLILALFLCLAWRGYKMAMDFYKAGDKFRYYLSFGITTSIVFQALSNIGVVGSVLPCTGIAMPFFSQGGSCMMVTMIMSVYLINLSRDRGSDGGNYEYD
ncbi:MAG: putative lipid II flippase FtsW [Spirochaetia bacterium]|nr:putative lipid II flippase FtsW [Spirochaetia bacterium]